jgi:putative membrane protein
MVALGMLVLVAVLSQVAPDVAAGFGGGAAAYLLGFVSVSWRRFSEQYGFTAGVAPDGIRVRRGLFSTVNETVPFERVQAVRRVEPLVWRLFGWCRLEVDVAGSPGQEQGTRSSRTTKALLPVGRRPVADAIFASLGLHEIPLARPPRRAAWKTPLRFHFLAGGHDAYTVAGSEGRVRRVTTWVPLQKVQSVRRAQGPWQRRFGLASVLVDAAGRGVHAGLYDRDAGEADQLVGELVAAGRQARERESSRLRSRAAGTATGPVPMPAPFPSPGAPHPAPGVPSPSPGYGPTAPPSAGSPPPPGAPEAPAPNPWAFPPSAEPSPDGGRSG